MPAIAKYQEGDSVNKKRNTAGGVSLEIGPDVGKIVGMRIKHDKKGRTGYYCTVKWKDGSTSEHAQHMLDPAP